MSKKKDYKERVELVVRRTKENDATASKDLIMKAYETAAKLHEGSKRKNGDPFIEHPVSVAEIVANNGGDQTMVVSALLHDTVEDTDYTLEQLAVSFGQDVADIVDALTNVEGIIPEDITDCHQRQHIKDYIDGLSNAKLLDPGNPQAGKAVYIRLADRLHNMRTLDAFDADQQVKKANDTRQFFVPLARLLHSKYFERELSELCFKVLEPDAYKEISLAYEVTRTRNSRHIEAFMQTFDLAVRRFAKEHAELFHKGRSYPFKCYQIHELLSNDGRPYGSMGSFSKSSIYLYEIRLSYSGPDTKRMVPDFIDLYQAGLRPNGVALEILPDYPSSTAAAFVLTDRLSNRYLVLLRPADSFALLPDYTSLFPPNVSVREMPDKVITVFSKDGKPYQMAEGSTVLDFAFRIHPDLGCSAMYALIRRGNSDFQTVVDSDGRKVAIQAETDVYCEIDHPIHEGDHIYVMAASNADGIPLYRAVYSWFSYVKTPYATKQLEEFFEKTNPITGTYDRRVSWEPSVKTLYKKEK